MRIASLVASLLFARVVAGFNLPSLRAKANGKSSRGVSTAEPDVKPAAGILEDFDEYSACLSPKEEKSDVLSERVEYYEKRPLMERAFRKVVPKKKRGALIMMHCGQSTFNANQTFTGWSDPELSPLGIQECEHAGRLMLAEGYLPDVIYTSRLKRAVKSAWTLLAEIDALYTPMFKTYRLNQRCYGSLEGLSKSETVKEFGTNVVQAWRTSLKARPPAYDRDDPRFPGNERRYADLPADRIPVTESLLDCHERARPLWEHKIRQDIEKGKNVLVVAHGDTLRGLVKAIDGVDDKNIGKVSVPNGIPFVYRFDESLKPVKPEDEELTQAHTSSIFLEKPGLLEKALKRQRGWIKNVPGIDEGFTKKRSSTMEDSLQKLRQEQNLFEKIEHAEDKKKTVEVSPVEQWSDDPSEFDDWSVFEKSETDDVTVTVEPLLEGQEESSGEREGFVVLIRHGQTPHNNLGLFTGWEDPPLADNGVEDAKRAGRTLKKHGFEFDVVYTSWLTRAIQTAHYVIDELDDVWLPVIKSWRLNERMYGALTGKSKKMIANEHGEAQLKKWRRGYTIRPPAVSSYSLSYPGNDLQRTKHCKDLRYSVTESFNRSIEQRKLVLHRKFPKTESLSDCMDRSIPFYTKRIREEAVSKGKRVLITSHENAIRGILMHLCDIPEYAMNQLHLPNGLPLVYSVKGRCISLLDDGSGQDPMKQHDFGPAAKYLFKPCEIDDAFYDEMAKKAP